jgi:hypothetical protein
VRGRRLIGLSAAVVAALVAAAVAVGTRPRPATDSCDETSYAVKGAGRGPWRPVADLDELVPRASAWSDRLLQAAGEIGTPALPAVRYNAEREGDELRYLYNEGVALRRQAGVLGYAFAATKDPRHLDRLADVVLRNATSWPDWNPGHPLDTAQVATAVALSYGWAGDRLVEAGRARVVDALVDRLLRPYVCDSDGVGRYRGARGNVSTVVGSAVALAALAVRDQRPVWADRAFDAASRSLDGNRAVEGGPTGEGLLYSNYEAANLALLWATVWANPDDPAISGTLRRRLPELGALAAWNECCGLAADFPLADSLPLYPWIDRTTALAAMAAWPESGPRVLSLIESLQAYDTLSVPRSGSWPVPDGIAELLLSSLSPVPPVGALVRSYVPDVAAPRYGGAANHDLTTVVSALTRDFGHAHADVGNVLVAHRGLPVLADLGKRDYVTRLRGPGWRAATPVHNTIGIRMPGGRVLQGSPGGGVVSLVDGALVMDSDQALAGVQWRRTVRTGESDVTVEDLLRTWPGGVDLSMSWLVPAPVDTVERHGANSLRYSLDDGSVWELVLPGGVAWTLSDASPVPPYVDSDEIARLAAAHSLVTIPLELGTRLSLTTQVRRVG